MFEGIFNNTFSSPWGQEGKEKKNSRYIPTVSENNLVYMQQHMQTARWCQVNAKNKKWRRNLGAYEDVLANQKPEEMWKWLNDISGAVELSYF